MGRNNQTHLLWYSVTAHMLTSFPRVRHGVWCEARVDW